MILYFREHRSEFPSWLKLLLGITRFLAIALIAFLLLSPLLKLSSHETEKPVIVFAQDNSLSMVLNKDSAFYRQDYLSSVNQMLNEIAEDYDVRLCTYGDEVKLLSSRLFDTLVYNEKESDIAALFDMMDVSFVNRNVGAMIIAGDGIYNKGFNPIYRAGGVSYPVYTIALGDTSEQQDAFFKRVLYNSIAFEGNDYPVEIIINASMLQDASLELEAREKGEILYSRRIPVRDNSFSQTITIKLPTGEEGLHHIVLTVDSKQDELTYENNRYDLFVEVLKSKQKVMILANSPHPDVSAIKSAIESNANYEVEDVLLENLNTTFEAYSLVILHQLPSYSPLSNDIMRRIGQAEVPLMYILGRQNDLRVFNTLNTGLQLSTVGRRTVNEVQPVLNGSFNNFGISKEMKDLLPFLPPLDVPFSQYSATNVANILFTQKIGDVKSPEPLWVLQEGTGVKTAVVAGTGLWKWRLKSWLISGGHDVFNELINKNVQYLAVKDDKRRFRVSSRQAYPENTSVNIQAELYNESFESINEPDVNIEISDEDGNKYNYIFSRASDAYILNAGGLDVGSYTFEATTRIGEELFSDRGGFAVTPVIKEQTRLRASHAMLKELSEMKDGQMFGKEQIDSIAQVLNDRGDLKPVLHTERKYIDFIDIWWVLIVILGLLSIEWFLRKWGGSY